MNTFGCISLVLCLQICLWWSDGNDLCSGKCDRTQLCVRHPRERRMVCILKRCMRLRSHGFCRKFTFRYYFDPLTFQCNRFAYGGCYGSRNNFLSKESCESRCTPPPVETKVFTAITVITTTIATTFTTTTTTTQTTRAVIPTIAMNTTTTTLTTNSTPTSTAPITPAIPIITLNTTASTPTTTTTLTTTTSTIEPTTSTPPSTTTPVSCGVPPSILGLQLLNFTNGSLPGDVRYYICQNASLTFDYRFIANSECSSIVCQNDGHWTHFNGTCSEPFVGLPTNANGSIARLSGRITSPNWPSAYVPPYNGIYRYSIITPGNSITFTFNGVFGIDSLSALVIFCGFHVPIGKQNVIYINSSTNPEPFICLTGCATVAFQVMDLGEGSRQGFDITWQANN